MTIGELKERIRGIDDSRPVIVIIDGITHFVSGVYVWDSTDDPKNDPVEMELLDVVEPKEE